MQEALQRIQSLDVIGLRLLFSKLKACPKNLPIDKHIEEVEARIAILTEEALEPDKCTVSTPPEHGDIPFSSYCVNKSDNSSEPTGANRSATNKT